MERVGYIRIVEIYISINSIDAAFIAILPQFIPAGCRTARAPARDPRIISLVDQLLPRKPCLRITVACVEDVYKRQAYSTESVLHQSSFSL